MFAANVEIRDMIAFKKGSTFSKLGSPIAILAESFNVIISLDVRGNIFVKVPTLVVSIINHLP